MKEVLGHHNEEMKDHCSAGSKEKARIIEIEGVTPGKRGKRKQ